MKITSIHLLPDQKPWKNKDTLIAFFNVRFACIELSDCMLIQTSRGFPLAQPPKGESPRGSGRFIRITDDGVRRAMTAAAYAAYQAIGGKELKKVESSDA